jgi:hypothetical protein
MNSSGEIKKKTKSIGIPNKWVKVDGNVRTSGHITCHLSGPDVQRGALNAIFWRSQFGGPLGPHHGPIMGHGRIWAQMGSCGPMRPM